MYKLWLFIHAEYNRLQWILFGGNTERDFLLAKMFNDYVKLSFHLTILHFLVLVCLVKSSKIHIYHYNMQKKKKKKKIL